MRYLFFHIKLLNLNLFFQENLLRLTFLMIFLFHQVSLLCSWFFVAVRTTQYYRVKITKSEIKILKSTSRGKRKINEIAFSFQTSKKYFKLTFSSLFSESFNANLPACIFSRINSLCSFF